jgi:hypothetical protein
LSHTCSLTHRSEQQVAILGATVDANVVIRAQALIKADLNEIVCAIARAATAILSSTVGAVGGIVSTVKDITQAEIAQLTASLSLIAGLVSNIKVVINLTATNLTPAIKSAITAEVAAVSTALSSLTAPLFDLVNAVKDASVSLSLNISGLVGVYGVLTAVIDGVLSTA